MVSFGVHKGLICSKSAYFKSRLEGGFKEASEAKVTLTDEDPDTFKRFNWWLYTGKVLFDEERVEDTNYDKLFDLYAFGEKRLIPHLQNACIDAVINRDIVTETIPYGEVVQQLWDKLPRQSPMRKLLTDLFVWNADIMEFFSKDEDIETYSKDFLASVLRGYHLAEDNDDPDFWEERQKYYS